MNESRFTAREKADAAAREAKQRAWVYRRLVAEGKKTQDAADRGIAVMQEIEADYRALAAYEATEAGRLV